MLSGRPIAVRFTKVVADGPRQARVGVPSKDDNISDHVVDEVKNVVVSCARMRLYFV